ncbi:transposase [Paucibacter oligotrophus]|uniref:Transposase n=1 Tax=Roseateles oligotrophus TaxID=1769250 RepID=A0A840LCY0_9BURK|nr:transposase [Roseateles oligotrophus]MBB4843177.1 transposase [Roseateles oligotrophus]
MKTVTGIAGEAPRRQHERLFKAKLVEQCLMQGASVAAIALAGGIKANLLFKWRRDHLRTKQLSGAASSSAVLVPVHVAQSSASAAHLQPLVVPQASPR